MKNKYYLEFRCRCRCCLWEKFASVLLLKWFFSEEDKILIKNLRQLKGYASTNFLREFETKNWTWRVLDYLWAKINRSVFVDHVAGSGRPQTACGAGNVAVVEEMACVHVPRAHFEHKFGLYWTELLFKLIILLNKPHFSLLCAN